MDGGQTPDDPNAAWRRPGGDEGVHVPAPAAAPASEAPPAPARESFAAGQRADIRKWLAGLQIQQLWHVFAVIAVVTTAGLGGMDTVAAAPAGFSLNQAHSTGELTIVVMRARLVPSIGKVFKPLEGRLYLALVANVTNDGTVPEGFGPFGRTVIPVQIPYQTAYPAPVIRQSDGSSARLQPGMTEELIFVWSVPSNALAVGDTATFRVPDRKFGDTATGFGRMWVDADSYADITVPIEGPK
ncbi:hypothetical protein FZI91_14900 [Mycobacterium sp. CBMA271]|uniref:hypothetical protein n=1 Tax=unclassified Mycobacteroides TaxID=2618759 RepID=UPI0012DF7F92|nr:MULTISPECIES: hypothetical protein [unclassified Mycobacteroides]MUM17740.1 hypothetical protein [Mycobacteroides sp. CBMA 326]MUM22985.1 hypothetical protein [Mycobacteroides sp. CBMA 271]